MDLLMMWLLSIGLFTSVLWGPKVWVPWPFPQSEGWLVHPQLKFLLEQTPPLAKGWPGPLATPPTDQHLLFLGLVYGGFGLLFGHLLFQFNDNWLVRIVWLGFAFAVWLVGLSLLGGMLSVVK